MSPKTPLKALAYTAIDLEATGLDPTRDRPVALGAVRLVGGRLGAELELLLDPGRPVGREAQALHGLSREALKGKPTLKEALPPFLAFLQGTVLLAHQAHVDLAFLPALKRFPLLDTYLLARFLLPLPGADPRLEALAERFGIPLLRRHTALGDARLVAEVFRHLLPLLEGAGVRTLEAGEFFGFPSLLSGEPPALSVVAKTPVKVLSFPQEAFQRLLMYPEVARFFGQGLVQRVQLRRVPEPSLFAPVGSLVRRPPALIPASATVEEAARRMREEGISSLLVEASPLGILTDRDLRNRVLAEGRPPTTPVAEVMTAPLFTLPVETPIYEALAAMVERGIHHLPLTEGEKVVGVVTHTDILLNQAQSPLLLLRRIERLELERYSPEVASLVESLFHRGLGGVEIGRVVASLNDALIRRLVKEAEAALGPPPVVYAFMVFGSEGRREQALLTDQDNALAVAEEGHEAYFQTLAEHVVGGLIRAGIPECKGGYMATRWRKTLRAWQDTFRHWMEAPEPQALLDTQIFFDFRSAAGSLSLKPLEEAVLEGSQKGVFRYHLAQASLAFRPPLGLFGRVRTEEGFIDLKRHALAPIVALARLYALMAGSLAKGTVERLKAAAEGGTLSQEGAERLEEAFRFFFALRLKHQLTALRQGKEVDNRVLWSALTPGERRRALEGFRAIAELQESTARSFQLR